MSAEFGRNRLRVYDEPLLESNSTAVPWRICAAFVIRLLMHALFVFRFLPYSQRNRPDHAHYFMFLAALAGAGFILVWRAPQAVIAVPLALTAALLAANTVMIAVDCWKDPRNHNLWPFEMAVLLLYGLPSWVGAATARLSGGSSG